MQDKLAEEQYKADLDKKKADEEKFFKELHDK